ncbi:LysR substrate-binding domain-containing protein [Caldimonas thermodepolymerans]|nr:LysR substrate-binding domain-containing protein [Caldimonas thermodepolymerans]UZG45135.1 LysR substrate-binding domain-containing protein [Caldimonas thermodepolymerans]
MSDETRMSLPLVRLPSLDLIKGFVAVGRQMSITQAADELCLTQSAVSKQIRTLEEVLGVPLFHRGYRSLAFTEHGELLFKVADACVQQLQSVVGLMAVQRPRPVTVTMSTSVAALWMLPRLGDFLAAHPDVDVRFAATNTVLEVGGDVDLAIRYCAPRHAPIGAIRLFGETIAPVAHPAIDPHCLDTREALAAVNLLEFDYPGRPWLHWADWLAARGWSTASAKAVLRFNQYEQMVQAALAGQGVALGRLELLQAPLRAGQLRLLEGPRVAPFDSGQAFWLIGAGDDVPDPVRRVADWILHCAQEVRTAAWAPLP